MFPPGFCTTDWQQCTPTVHTDVHTCAHLYNVIMYRGWQAVMPAVNQVVILQ